MRKPALLLATLSLFLLGACVMTRGTRAAEMAAPAAAQAYTADPGPYAVATVEYTWTDPARNRQVPVKIYYPQAPGGPNGAIATGPFPVIVFSHGLGGTRENYAYLGEHWASYGYVSVHPQHIGSDDSVWKSGGNPLQAMTRSLMDFQNAQNRPADISFTVDELTRLNQADPFWQGHLDMNRLGMAGHSFGGWTTMAIAGELTLAGQQQSSAADPRFKAAIAMSAPPSFNRRQLERVYAPITMPLLTMTGTKDDIIILPSLNPADRRIAFDYITNAEEFLLIFNGADHLTFSGHGNLPGHELDAQFQPYILMCSTAFWDAYLKGDAGARAWLTQGGWAGVLDGEGTWEQKLKG
jgi:predicted dienelactone hydrolase